MRVSMLLCAAILAVSINYATGIFFPILAVPAATTAATTVTLSSGALAAFGAAAGIVGLAGGALLVGGLAASAGRRGKRSAEEKAQLLENDLVWDLLRALDKYNCGALLVCSLEGKESRAADEQNVVDLFDNLLEEDSEILQVASSRQYYEQAARLGRQFGYEQCRASFRDCPASPEVIMQVARNLN